MGLSYHFQFRAPREVESSELAEWLRAIEGDARLLGFGPTIVVDARFDSRERCDFARRVARPLTVKDSRLRNVALADGLCWSYIADAGVCRLAPTGGVLLVLTDERGIETVFGFLRYPTSIRDSSGREIMHVPEAEDWLYSNWVDSPDPRYRAIVRRFREAGYLADEHDEFAPVPL